MTKLVVVSGKPISKYGLEPNLVTGPYDDMGSASEIKSLLEQTVSGRHLILKCHYLSPERRNTNDSSK